MLDGCVSDPGIRSLHRIAQRGGGGGGVRVHVRVPRSAAVPALPPPFRCYCFFRTPSRSLLWSLLSKHRALGAVRPLSKRNGLPTCSCRARTPRGREDQHPAPPPGFLYQRPTRSATKRHEEAGREREREVEAEAEAEAEEKAKESAVERWARVISCRPRNFNSPKFSSFSFIPRRRPFTTAFAVVNRHSADDSCFPYTIAPSNLYRSWAAGNKGNSSGSKRERGAGGFYCCTEGGGGSSSSCASTKAPSGGAAVPISGASSSSSGIYASLAPFLFRPRSKSRSKSGSKSRAGSAKDGGPSPHQHLVQLVGGRGYGAGGRSRQTAVQDGAVTCEVRRSTRGGSNGGGSAGGGWLGMCQSVSQRVIPMGSASQHNLPARMETAIVGAAPMSIAGSGDDLPSPLFAAQSPLALGPRLGVVGFSRSGYTAVPRGVNAAESGRGGGGGRKGEEQEDRMEGEGQGEVVEDKGVIHDEVKVHIPEEDRSELLGDAVCVGALRLESSGCGRKARKKKRGAPVDDKTGQLKGKVFRWGEDFTLNMNEVVAVTWGQGELKFTLHAFPYKSQGCFSRPKRKRVDFHFAVHSPEQAKSWMTGFTEAGCRVILPDPTNATNVPGSGGNGGAEVTPEANLEGLSPKVKAMWSLPGAKVLVIVNPKSGHGKAKKVLCSDVLPIFELAGLRYSVLETSCPRHAERLAAAADLSTCSDGIVCVGGDGIVNEVLNGLFSRKDSAQAMEVPIGIIPAGSDNSLCWSVLGIRDPISAAISIVKGGAVAVDAFAVRWGTGMFQLGLCTAYYGFMSDVLELSASYHKTFGPLRYAVAGMQRMMKLPTYDLLVEFIPVDDSADSQSAGFDHASVPGMCGDLPAMKANGDEKGSMDITEEKVRLEAPDVFSVDKSGMEEAAGWREDPVPVQRSPLSHSVVGEIGLDPSGGMVAGGKGVIEDDLAVKGPPVIPVIGEVRGGPAPCERVDEGGSNDAQRDAVVEDLCKRVGGGALGDEKGVQGDGMDRFRRFLLGSKVRKSVSACNLFVEKGSGHGAAPPLKSRRCSSEKFAALPSEEPAPEVLTTSSCSPSCSPKTRNRAGVLYKGRSSGDAGGIPGSKLGSGWVPVSVENGKSEEVKEKEREKKGSKHGGNCFPVGFVTIGLKSWKKGSKKSKGDESSGKGEGKGNGRALDDRVVVKITEDGVQSCQGAVGGKWVQRQGPFLCVIACNHRCKSVQCFDSQSLAPLAGADDGALDLLLVRSVGRFQLLRFLFMMQFGRHITLPYVEYTKTRAVRLTPGKNAHRSCGIDGELMPLEEPILTAVLPSQCRLIGRPSCHC